MKNLTRYSTWYLSSVIIIRHFKLNYLFLHTVIFQIQSLSMHHISQHLKCALLQIWITKFFKFFPYIYVFLIHVNIINDFNLINLIQNILENSSRLLIEIWALYHTLSCLFIKLNSTWNSRIAACQIKLQW